jgi:hypothetical protein
MDGPEELFKFLYILCGFFSAFAIVLLFILTIIDMISFIGTETGQNIALSQNPNLFNKDGIDFQNLLYSENKPEKEPYTIYLQQQIIASLFIFVGIVVGIAVLDLCVGAGLYTVAYFRDKEFNFSLGLTDRETVMQPFQSIGLMVVFAFIYGLYYRGSFTNTIQMDIIDAKAKLETITKLIYDNLSTNEEFLKTIQNDDVEESYKIILKQGNRPDTIGSMIFTLALFNYYKMNTVSSIETIKKIFSTTQIRLRQIVPVDYMYYNQNPFIPNIYPEIEKKLYRILNNESTKYAVRKNVSTRINNVNRLLSSIFKMKSIRSSIRLHLFICFIIALIFVLILSFFVYPELKDKIKNVLLYNNGLL